MLWDHIKINVNSVSYVFIFLDEDCNITQNTICISHERNKEKHFHFSFCLSFYPGTQAIIHTLWLHRNLFRSKCPLLIICWWLALEAFWLIINSLRGESEGLHEENTSVDISLPFSAAGRCLLLQGLHFLWHHQLVSGRSYRWKWKVVEIEAYRISSTSYHLLWPVILHLSAG